MNKAIESPFTVSTCAAVDDDLSYDERIVEFYETAGMDYGHWSRGLNMHLGFYRRGMNPFDREAMFEQLNLEVAQRLNVASDKRAFLVDLGCGMGAIARTIARKFPTALIKGITLVPSQVRLGNELNVAADVGSQVEILLGNYTKLPFDDATVDGAWAVESACYSDGPDKSDLVAEAARIIRPGGRFVVSDCFVINESKPLNPLVNRCYQAACRYWAVKEMPSLGPYVESLKKNGFCDVLVEDISWPAAPSVAHAPFAVLTFVLKKLFSGSRLSRSSIHNLRASLLAPVLGLNRSKFSYCLISAQRR